MEMNAMKADFGAATSYGATQESNEMEHEQTQPSDCLVDLVLDNMEQSHDAGVPTSTTQIDREIVCTVCDGDITGLSIIGRNVHMNRCLDTQLQQLDRGGSFASTAVSDIQCPHCSINLCNFSEERRIVHVNLCLDRGSRSSSQLNNTSAKHDDARIKSSSASPNSDRIVSAENGIVPECNICGVSLIAKTLAARVTHIKQCSKRHTRSGQSPSHRGGSAQSIVIESLIECSTMVSGTPSELQHTDGSTSGIKRAARNAFDIMMQGSQALKRLSKIQSPQFSGLGSIGKSWKKPKLASENAKRVPELKCPEYKIILGTKPRFIVDGFRFASKDLSSVYFLTHFHSDHYIGLTKKFDAGTIYCSQITANLVMMKLRVDVKYICIVAINTPIVIHGVEVIFLDANHCPGACIILFRQKNEMSFLHTGDFRFHPRMLEYPALRPYINDSTQNGMRRLSGVYLDTTYAKSKFDFAPQEIVIKHVVELMEEHYSTHRDMYIFGTYTIGKERVFMEVAKHFGKKMCVSKEKFRVLSCYGWDEKDMDFITTDSGDTCFFVMPMHSLRMDRLPGLLRSYSNRFDRVVAFRPTGWTFQGVKASLSKLQKDASDRFRVYGIPYSEHSSFSELCQFVKAFRPKTIIPTVNCSSRQKMTEQVDLIRRATSKLA